MMNKENEIRRMIRETASAIEDATSAFQMTPASMIFTVEHDDEIAAEIATYSILCHAEALALCESIEAHRTKSIAAAGAAIAEEIRTVEDSPIHEAVAEIARYQMSETRAASDPRPSFL